MPYQPEYSSGDMIYGRYKIISFISRGGFGETYKVEDTQRVGLICLLKYLKPLNTSPGLLRIAEEKFSQEADTLRRLGTHKQIPQLYDYFEENQRFYLLEEYIDGQNLADELKTRLFSEIQVIEVLYDTLKVLDYLFQNKVIHRDIKPENLIRRSSDNKIVLVDFGAVKEINTLAVDAYGQTISTIAIGTPGFMPPEQSDRRPKYASDIYALGVSALQLLTGNILQQNQEIKIILSEVKISPYLAKILENMVQFNYKERYQKPTDIILDLQPLTLLEQTLNQRYHIKSYLGGDICHTFLAEDLQRSSKSECIIKQLQIKINNQHVLQEVQNRFASTVEFLQKLSHEQIPRFLNNFQENEEFYLVYEFIWGENLLRQLSTENRWNELDVIMLLKDVLKVLSFMHQQGIIHGDIKPSNLIRRQLNGKICVIYLTGLKQIINLNVDSKKIVDTPSVTDGYMPPEELKSQNKLQPASDIYALGMIAIQALTGVRPEQLKTDSRGKIIWRNLGNFSPRLARILEKMVHSQAEKRYQSVHKVLYDLNALILWNNIEKWRITAIIIIFIGLGIPYCYNTYFELEAEESDYNLGSSKIAQGDSSKNTGDIERARKYYNEAITAFEKAIKTNPKFLEAWVNKGYAHGQLRDFVGQSYSCTTATIIDDKDSVAWICLGNAQVASEQYEDSIKSFTKATEICNSLPIDNSCITAWNNIGDIYLILNKPQEALDAYKKALNFKKDYLPALKGLKEAERRLNLP